MSSYGQFCPVALASDLLTRRWTPLVIRELLSGSTRFNEVRRGVPKMSPSLLSRRLDELVDAGVIERIRKGDHDEYRLTRAGRELMPIIEAMGVWGKRWISGDLAGQGLDSDLLMWDVRRRIDTAAAPQGRTIVRFTFEDRPPKHRDYWIVIHSDRDVDLCWKDPGYPVDLAVDTDLRTMTDVWMGLIPFAEALRRREVSLKGPPALRRSFPKWLGFSLFANVSSAPAVRSRRAHAPRAVGSR